VRALALIPILVLGTQIGVQHQLQLQAPNDPWAGAWKLNVAKSTFHGAAPRQETVTIAPAGADTLAFKYAVTGAGPDGSPIHVTYDGRTDGKLYPHLVNGVPTGDVRYVRVSSHETTCNFSYADGSAGVQTMTLSSDGRTFTVHQHYIKGPQGAYDETHVFEKA
jgi:hypothetical protein